MHALRIFLSSPGDVAEEREIVREVVEQVANSHLVRGKVAIQINAWDDPHASTPMDAGETPQMSVNRHTSLPAECDLTVVIIWGRIGTPLPPGLTRADGSPFESGTVWEYENALQADKPVYVYRKTASPQIALDDPLFEDKRTQYAQVKRFFEGFRNPDGSLRAGINNITNADAFRATFRQHLEAFLKPHVEQMPAPPPVVERAFRWPNPWDFTAYMAEKRGGFAGREWLFTEIAAWLTDPESRALLIRADYGVGKSAFLSELLARDAGRAIVGWHFCQHDTRETLRAGSFVRSLAAQLMNHLPGYREEVEAKKELQERLDRALEDPGSAFEAVVLNPLVTLPDPVIPRLVVIDALDEALEVDAEDANRAGTLVALLANKARRLPSWLRVIVTSRNNPEVITRLQQAFSLKQIDAEGVQNQDDLYAYALKRAKHGLVAAQLAESGKRAEWLATLLCDKGGGKFLYVARALRDLEDGRLTLDQAQLLPPGMDSFYLDTFERRFEHIGQSYESFRAQLGLLCALHEPVASNTLAEILGCEASQTKQARALLPDFIVQRRSGLTFEHFSIAEWLSRENEDGYPRAGQYAVDLVEAERMVRHWAMLRVSAGSAHDVDYLVRHLALHLPDEIERRSIFSTLMFDYRWLRARLELAGVDALISDCRQLGNCNEAHLLAASLRNSAHVLRRNPDQLASQLIGRLSGYTEHTEIHNLCASAGTEVNCQVVKGKLAAAIIPQNGSLRLDTSLLAVLEGHSGAAVCALAALPDGRLASAGSDCMIRLWHVASGEEPQVLEGHSGCVNALDVLADGRLVSCSDDGTVRLWDLLGGTECRVLRGHKDWVRTLVVLPDGKLASGSSDETIRLWDLAGGAEPKVLEGHRGTVNALAVLPDGRLASGSSDGTILLWDLSGSAEPRVLRSHRKWVNALSVLPDGRLASGSSDGTIRVWNLIDSAEPSVLISHRNDVNALAMLPDGQLASGRGDGTILLWDLAGRAEPRLLEGHSGRGVYALTVLPNGWLASAGGDCTIQLWNIADGPEPQICERHDGEARALTMLPDRRFALGGVDGTIRILDIIGRTEPKVLEGHNNGVAALAALPDGRLASGSLDWTIRLWDLAGGVKPRVLEGHRGTVNALAVLPDGRLASGSSDGTIRLWNLAGEAEPTVLEGHRDRVRALVVLPNGWLASGSADRTVRLWDLAAGAEPRVRKLTGHRNWVNALAKLPGGWLASGSADGTIRLWDPAGNIEPRVLDGHCKLIVALSVLPERWLVAADGAKVMAWRLPSAQIHVRFEADAEITCLLAVSSSQVIAGDASGRLHILELIEPQTRYN